MGKRGLGCGRFLFAHVSVAVLWKFLVWLEIPQSPLEFIDVIIWYSGINFSAPGSEGWLKRSLDAIGTTSSAQVVRPTRQRRRMLPWHMADAKARTTLAQMKEQEKYALLRGSKSVAVGEDTINGTAFEWRTEGFYTGNTLAIPRLGVPALKMQDAANGFRPDGEIEIGSTTAWLSMLALASTWDVNLTEDVAAAIASEFRGKGANVLLGPSIQVHRTAWGGRNFEYIAGEDPYLGAQLAAAYVRGANSEGVITTAKHWAFNEQETRRFTNNVTVDERTAWELYYPPFEAAVEAGIGAVMCSYNRVNGTHACTNDELLKRDLKERMGFRGYVQCDWGAAYKYTRSVEHGLDQNMPGDDNLFSDEVLGALTHGAVDEAARRVLAAIYHAQLDEEPGCAPPDCKAERASYQRTAEHRALAARAASEAVVLLKNDGILPLRRERVQRIAVVGAAAHAEPGNIAILPNYYAGGGSGNVPMGSWVSPLDGILRRASKEGMLVVASPNSSIPEALHAASMAQVVIAVVGTSASEFMDRPHLSLHDDGDALIAAVARRRPTIVLMQTPGAVVMPWLDQAAAVANLFLAGEATGLAWANLLFGDISPAGKLPIMFPASEEDTIKPLPKQVNYSEGLFTSYRNPSLRAAFPFGHGLSYTRFEYGVPQAFRGLSSGCPAPAHSCLRLAVRNVGERAGAEVVQAYLEFPLAGPDTPQRMLRGFQKTSVLEPGALEEVRFSFTKRDLSIYSVEATGWVLQELAQVHVGASSADLRHELRLPL